MLDKLEKDELLPSLAKYYDCRYGIEVGVRDGSNMRNLLTQTNMIIYGVDMLRYPQISEIERDFGARFYFIHQTSEYAAGCMADDSLDFIYIDANHNYDGIHADLHLWYSKLKVGGVFCGDDFCNCWNPQEGQYEVVRAVEEFIEDKAVKLYISSLGIVDKDYRLYYANKIGKLHEDNFTGRKRTEGVPVPQWWFIKDK